MDPKFTFKRIRRVLIANRGEIAVRLIRACNELRLECVALYTESDASSHHTENATQKVLVKSSTGASSYTDV